ncbi:MAG: 23S rRNA (uracil(1939)-C(5))-methyltransferase RlmD [Fretibacterium sp.]|nr:23S rRNA (uracil(1939)-C(5))-methyltransferase RlmD [Fretibacterium sp.]
MTKITGHGGAPQILTIDAFSSDGSGIARTEEHGVIFVKGALPGETVEAEMYSRRRDFSLARTLQVLSPTPGRVEPSCPVYGSCGACQLQHASYELQLELKAGVVRDALIRIGGFEVGPLTCTASPDIWGYRNKASFPIQAVRGRPTAGFYQANTHRLIPLDTCPVNARPLNDIYQAVQTRLADLPLYAYDERKHKGELRHLVIRAGLRTEENLLSFVINGRLSAKQVKALAAVSRFLPRSTTLTLNHNSKPGNVILGARTEALVGDGLLSEHLDDWTLTFDTTSFFQVNTKQAEQLYRHVRESVRGADEILELYSGVGSLTCYLAMEGRVTAIEEWRSAVKMAERNMAANGLEATLLCGRAEDLVEGLKEKYDCVVLDPPRGGCDRSVIDAIASLKIPRVVYVSCNPATLARDARILAEHGYRLNSVQAFDMFPQTVHVETAVLMSIKSKT